METRIPICDCTAIHKDVILRVSAAQPAIDDFYALSNLYKCFADKTRVQILWVLGNEDMCVCDLAALLGMTKSAVSHQLNALKLSNLVKYRRQGKVVTYSLADAHVRDILEKGMEHIHE